MSQLWKNNRFVNDTFVPVDDAASLPQATPVIVSLKRWRESRGELLALKAPIGVAVDPTAEFDADTDDLGKLALIAIPFAKFTDGRGYSLARRVRDTLNFKGEVRATGEVLIDQIPLMLRCGFDSFVVSHAPTLRTLEAGHLSVVREVYQTAVYGRARTTPSFGRPPVLEAAE